jgi:hypothetical protein
MARSNHTGRGGPAQGKPQPHRRASYDASSGRPWRTGVALPPDAAAKAVKASERANLSFAGLVTDLIRRMDVDETGRPTWHEQKDPQEELPDAE